MVDSDGNVLTEPRDINNEAMKHFKNVLENKPIDNNLKHVQKARENLSIKRMEIAARNKTVDWTIDDLNRALKDLKNNKSRDPNGHINEIYKDKVIGDYLK